MLMTKTPLRISFFGGGTDYPEYFNNHGGSVFGMAIDKYVYVSLRPLHDFFNARYKIVYSLTESTWSVPEIKHPSVRACLQHLAYKRTLELHHVADWPARTGLGSSSSFTVGLLTGLYAMEKKTISAAQAAEEAIHVERSIIGERVGCQDQVWAAFGGVGTIDFFSDTRFEWTGVEVSPEQEQAFVDHTALFYLDVARFAHDVLDEQMKKTIARDNDAMLGTMRELVVPGRESFLAGDFETFGSLLHRSWELKQQLSSKIAPPLVCETYRTALTAGAFGGKLLGAGGGGFMLFVVAPEKKQALIKALHPLKTAPFGIARTGSQVVYRED